MGKSPGSVLLVESDSGRREQVAAWLECAGFEVTMCPGPSAPDYTCIGGRGGSCPLVHGVDLIVLDLWIAGDMVQHGTSATDLLGYYVASGKPVIAFSHGDGEARLFAEEELVDLGWPPGRQELVEAARALLGAGREDLSQTGIVTRTVVPSSGELSMSKAAPRDVARS
jgi:hypothetical protein